MKGKAMKRLLVMLFLMWSGLSCLAQEGGASKPQSKEPAIYKFDFTVYELQNGKKSNVRNYSMFLQEHRKGAIKVGNRVPIAAIVKDGVFQYIDVGLNIECTFEESGGAAVLNFKVDLGSIVTPDQGDTRSSSPVTNPVVRQLRHEADAYVVAGKPTVIASIDDTNTPRTVQLEVTATKLK
jgi:hypothetical protein